MWQTSGKIRLLVAALASALLASPAAARSAQDHPSFDACLERAADESGAIQLCANAAIAAASAELGPPKGTSNEDFQQSLIVLGDDAIARGVFGEGRSAEVAVAQAAVRLARARLALLRDRSVSTAGPGQPAALGPDARTAWARSRRSDCKAYPVADCAARYDRLLAAYAPALEERKSQPLAAERRIGLPLLTCAEVRASALLSGALADAFYDRYPKNLADPTVVGTIALNEAEIANVVDYLVCVAGRTEYDPVVVENGLALFADPMHGAVATARLDALTKATGGEAQSARTFREQVHGYLRGPGQ